MDKYVDENEILLVLKNRYLNKSKSAKLVSRFFKKFFISRIVYISILSFSQESILTSVVCLMVKETAVFVI